MKSQWDFVILPLESTQGLSLTSLIRKITSTLKESRFRKVKDFAYG